ncbi:Uncharacterised protein [Vibrio cholerae]|nr:Uncharacterised protein [Vibrio cholerae]
MPAREQTRQLNDENPPNKSLAVMAHHRPAVETTKLQCVGLTHGKYRAPLNFEQSGIRHPLDSITTDFWPQPQVRESKS